MKDSLLILPKHFQLKNKYSLITGAAGLLGFEHAYALLELGSGVILTDIDNDKLISGSIFGRFRICAEKIPSHRLYRIQNTVLLIYFGA